MIPAAGLPRRPLRLALVVSSLCFGGAEKHIVTLANRLAAAGHQIWLVYLKPVEALLPQVQREALQGVQCLHVSRKLDLRAVNALAELVNRNSIDALLCVNEYPALYALLAARRTRVRPRLVEIFHTTTFGRLKDEFQMLLYRVVLRRFDLLVYVSERQREHWLRRGLRAHRDLVIHNGIDLARFVADEHDPAQTRASLGLSSDDYVVGICAALRPEKAHGDLLQAVALLRDRLPHLRVLVIGDGPERPGIERRIAELDLQQRVIITGFQSDVRPFVAACDVMVLCSRAVETFSIAALEAMALARPLVLSRIGGADEQVVPGITGELFEAGDVPALARHLETLADKPLSRRMGEAAALRVRERFTEQKMVDGFEAALAELVAKG